MNETRLAFVSVPVLVVIAVVAIAALLARSRSVFVGGVVGAIVSLLVPERTEYATYRSVESAVMDSLWKAFWHVAFWSTVLAAIGAICGAFIHRRSKRQDFPK